MIIFHSFKDRAAAERYAEWVVTTAKRSAIVCGSQSESNQIEGFLFPLVPPIVLVDQPLMRQPTEAAKKLKIKAEKKVVDAAYRFGGCIANVIQ